MIFQEDYTFRDLRERSVQDWLCQMEQHEDLAVRGGVKVTREYIESLKTEIRRLEEKNALKERYLKKLKTEKTLLMEERNI